MQGFIFASGSAGRIGANLQFVFYCSKKSPFLFKVHLNGEEARLPLETDNWPYYDWQAFKSRYGR